MRRKRVSSDILICPICHKEFTPTDETKFIRKGGYTCSWDCFTYGMVKHTEKRKRGRPRKSEI